MRKFYGKYLNLFWKQVDTYWKNLKYFKIICETQRKQSLYEISVFFVKSLPSFRNVKLSKIFEQECQTIKEKVN